MAGGRDGKELSQALNNGQYNGLKYGHGLLGVLGTMKDRKDFNDKTSHHNYRAERQAQEAKAMGLIVQCHDGETGHQDQQADDHQLIVFLSKG